MAPHYPQVLHLNPGLYLQPHHPPPGTSSIIPIPWMLIRSPSPSLFYAYKTLLTIFNQLNHFFWRKLSLSFFLFPDPWRQLISPSFVTLTLSSSFVSASFHASLPLEEKQIFIHFCITSPWMMPVSTNTYWINYDVCGWSIFHSFQNSC